MRLALLPHLARAGLHITLVLHARTGALAGSLPPGIGLVELGGRSTLHDIAPLARFLRARAPDVLVSSLDHNNVAAMLAKQAAGPRTRLVICQHNALSSEARHGGGWRYRLLPLAYRTLGFAADAIVAVSAGVAEDLVRTTGLPAAKLRVIHNPVIDDAFAARMAADAPDPWLDDPTVPVFVAVGRLVDQKDPQTLLCGFAQFRALAPGRLLLLGEGTLRGGLEALASELGIAADVRFLGFRANPLPYIRRAAALLLTSRYEGLGNVLIEALGCGTPVISTDCPYGPAEILDGGAYGSLIPVGDPAALAAEMLSDPRARWPAALLRRRAADFTLAAAAQRYLDLLRGLCPTAARAA
jgi:glycosyltransferase involved in cell wall biosynthesis